jgi:ATP-dependent RNA helicase DHX8/PRP22
VEKRKGSLKLIITSATLRTTQLSDFFNNCPVLSVSGRCYPVSILHKETQKHKRLDDTIQAAIRIHLNEPAGDILAFLTGFEECEQACTKCMRKLTELDAQGKEVPPMMLVALHGSQSPEQQQNAFIETPEGVRKIIFATNIAETSLTVDNVGYVIDCGFVKQKQFSAETGMESLVVVPISKVQAVQRSGRAGRTREGKCLRLYTEEFYNKEMPN